MTQASYYYPAKSLLNHIVQFWSAVTTMWMHGIEQHEKMTNSIRRGQLLIALLVRLPMWTANFCQ